MSSLMMAILVIIAVILVLMGLDRLATPRPKKETETAIVDGPSLSKKRKKLTRWIIPFIIALIITFMTVAGGLFFFAIAGLMLIDPSPRSKTIHFPTDAEIKSAKRLYAWLWWSSIITVPFFLLSMDFNLYASSSTNERVTTALMPLFFHLVLLLGLSSKSAFVYRHTQQAIFLIALRAGMAALALNIDAYPPDGLWLFIFGNGSLWLFGTLWGRNQVVRGNCWWAERKGDTILPKEGVDAETEMAALAAELKKSGDIPPREHLKKGWSLVDQRKGLAKAHALEAFRSGDKVIKNQAVDLLKQLGEVEQF